MDDFVFAIIRLMCWPYEIWKNSIESSRIGSSSADHDTLRFWKQFAIYGSLVLLTVTAGVLGIFAALK